MPRRQHVGTGSNRRHGTAVPPRANVGRMDGEVTQCRQFALLVSYRSLASIDCLQKKGLKKAAKITYT